MLFTLFSLIFEDRRHSDKVHNIGFQSLGQKKKKNTPHTPSITSQTMSVDMHTSRQILERIVHTPHTCVCQTHTERHQAVKIPVDSLNQSRINES